MLSIIAAIGKNREMGKENSLLWFLPADIKHFREYTKDSPVIMGRKTYESIGHPLLNRKNIIISRNPKFRPIGTDVTDSFDSALHIARNFGKPPIVIGGAQIYRRALPLATDMCLTFVNADFPSADCFFPEINFLEWEEIKRKHYPADGENIYSFDIVCFKRKGKEELENQEKSPFDSVGGSKT